MRFSRDKANTARDKIIQNAFLHAINLDLRTMGDQKVRGKVLLNRIAFIGCNENS